MDINDYINGTPIEPGVTYKLGNADANSAWTLVSDRPCLFKLSATAPTDSAWSNVTEEQYIINGDVSNQVIEITSPNGKYFVVATHDQDSAATVESAYATVSLKPLGFNVEDSYETTPLSGDGPVTEGFYKISNLESGKLYSFNVTPDAGGLKATNPSPEYAFSLFSVDGSNNPKALLAAGITECQLVFVATESTAVLNLSSTLPDSEFFVCIRNFSLGSGGSGFDPSSDQSITGAWTFSNITVPTPSNQGQAANKGYVDGTISTLAVLKQGNETIAGIKTFSSPPVVPSPTANNQAAPKSYVDSAVDSVHEFDPAEAQNITGSWSFSDGLTRTTKASPANTDIMNKEMSDAVYVPKAGDSTVEGTKTFSGSITLANEAPLVLGTGTVAVKISGSGTGSAVIEGGNDATLDVAVPVSLQETVAMTKFTSDISEIPSAQSPITLWELQSLNDGCLITQTIPNGHLTLTAKAFTSGITIQNNGWAITNSAGQCNGGYIFRGGVTFSQTITVAQTATFNGSVTLGNSAKISGSILDESAISDTTYVPVGNSDQRYIKYKELTKADYDALETKSNSTIYFLTDQTMWAIGTKELVTSDMPA